MQAAQNFPDIRANMADLQEEPYKIIAFATTVVGVVWFLLLLRSAVLEYGIAPASIWLGSIILSTTAYFGYRLKNSHFRLATYLLIWGMLGAAICIVYALPSPMLTYLFILPIIFGSVLLNNQKGFFLVAITAGVAIFVINMLRIEEITFGVDVGLPLLILALITIATRFSVNNLYTALAWAMNAYERARRNEQIAQERQAQLHQALKALDQAYYNLERSNSLLVIAREEAEASRFLKQQFAQNISHELRTPLSLIIGFSETMATAPETYGDMKWSPILRGDVDQIYQSSKHLSSLIDDILDLAALDAQQFGLDMQEVNLGDLIAETVAVIKGFFDAKGLYLTIDVDPDLPILRLDPTRIRQVLLNLLNNASRFTNEGGVVITTKFLHDAVQISIADTGIGITSQDIPKVFEEFRQVDGSTRRNHEGTGLGIPLSRRLIELHNGRMWLESEPGRGSTFYFTLPIAINGANKHLPKWQGYKPQANGSRTTYRKSVLVLQPGPLLLHTIRRSLGDIDVIEIPEKKMIPQMIETHQPVALVVHDQLDDMGAFTATMPSDLPVVTFPMAGSMGDLQRLQVQAFLIKPIVREDLLTAVSEAGDDIHTIFIIDDNPQQVELASRMLKSTKKAYRTIKCYGGTDVLSRLQEKQPDLVLLDLVMPEMDGKTILEGMRVDPLLANIPVIVTSAYQYQEMGIPRGGQQVRLYREEEFSMAELLTSLQAILNTMPLRMPTSA